MITSMLADVICHEFDRKVGKRQGNARLAMHVGFGLRTEGEDQYRVRHMFLYAPMNYVYVASMEERIDEAGDRHVTPTVLHCYHDSCWTGAVNDLVFKHRDEVNVFHSLGRLFDWNTVITLTEQEEEHLGALDDARGNKEVAARLDTNDPFSKRGCWSGQHVDYAPPVSPLTAEAVSQVIEELMPSPTGSHEAAVKIAKLAAGIRP